MRHGLSISSYSHQISPSTVNTTEVAPPRRHTIAYTELRQDQALPGIQPQVIVLEKTPADDSRALIRGADWNATTRGGISQYEKIWIQPIQRVSVLNVVRSSQVLDPPLQLIDTLRLPLDSSAPNGATATLELLQSLGLQDTFSGCKGCTFFIPNDGALALVNVSALNGAQKANVLLNHVSYIILLIALYHITDIDDIGHQRRCTILYRIRCRRHLDERCGSNSCLRCQYDWRIYHQRWSYSEDSPE